MVIGVKAGDAFVFSYPFVRCTYTVWDEDGSAETPSWKPGVRFEDGYQGEPETLADGLGFQHISVIGTFKPGKYPERVFYTRKWTNPDGSIFGKGALRTCTIAAFRTLVSGYRHGFVMSEEK